MQDIQDIKDVIPSKDEVVAKAESYWSQVPDFVLDYWYIWVGLAWFAGALATFSILLSRFRREDIEEATPMIPSQSPDLIERERAKIAASKRGKRARALIQRSVLWPGYVVYAIVMGILGFAGRLCFGSLASRSDNQRQEYVSCPQCDSRIEIGRTHRCPNGVGDNRVRCNNCGSNVPVLERHICT